MNGLGKFVAGLISAGVVFGLGCVPEQDPVTGQQINRVGGVASGLTGLVVADINGEHKIQLAKDGPYQFYFYPLNEGHAYNVSVESDPFDSDCVVENGLGVVGADDVTDVNIVCSKVDPLIADIPFTDPSLQTCVLSHANDANAQYASELKSLNCSSMGISSLKGLEYFVNLVDLRVSGNALTAVDLSYFPKLVQAHLYSNMIESVVTTGNTSLKVLHLNRNQLKAIDLSDNVALTYLSLYRNLLTEINLDTNVDLDFVDLHNNPLETATLDYLSTLSIPTLVL